MRASHFGPEFTDPFERIQPNLQTERSSCSEPSCSVCDSCNPAALKSELFHCYQGVDALRFRLSENLSPLDIERECTFGLCYAVQRKRYCGLLDDATGGNVQDKLTKILVARKKELATLKAELQNKKAPYERNGLLRYGKSMEHARNVMAEQRADALQARAYNTKLKSYLESFEHRRATYEVERLGFQNEDLYGQKRFWDAQNQTLAHAVRLSAGAIKDARNDLHDKMLECETDTRLLTVLRQATLAKEEQVKVVGALKEELRRRLDLTHTTNAHAKREAVFIEGARQEIYKLLQSVLDRMRNGRLQVECGGRALSESVQNELET